MKKDLKRQFDKFKKLCLVLFLSGVIYLTVLLTSYFIGVLRISAFANNPFIIILRAVLVTVSILLYPALLKLKNSFFASDKLYKKIEDFKLKLNKNEKERKITGTEEVVHIYYMSRVLILYIVAEVPQLFGLVLGLNGIAEPIRPIEMLYVILLILIGFYYKYKLYPEESELMDVIKRVT